MRILLVLACAAAFSGSALAADTTAVKAAQPPEKKAPVVAPAPVTEAPVAQPTPKSAEVPVPAAAVSAPAPVLVVVPQPTGAVVTPATVAWYGMAMLRFRDEILTNYRAGGLREESANFSYQLAYKLGVKANPNDQVMLQFELGNDWYATDEVEGLPGNYWTKRDPLTPWFDLAFAQWNPGFMHVQAGIIPVAGTPLMDLLGVSIFFGRDYKKAAHIPWGVVTNFSQTGLRLGAPIVKGPVAFGVDAMAAVIEMRKIGVPVLDTMMTNPLAIEFELEAPLVAGGLTVTPQAFVTPNRSYNMSTKKSDLEFGLGFNSGFKLNSDVTLRAGFGYARNSNRNSHVNADGKTYNAINDTYGDPFNITAKTDVINSYLDSALYDRWGTNLNVGSTVLLGPGKFDFDFNLSSDQDMYNKNIYDWYPFFDFKYGWAVNKNFVIMPRIRLFFTEPKAAIKVITYENMLTTRPELIFCGTF
jgi:hypothetical protein